MKQQNGAREEVFSLEQRGPAPNHGQEVAQPASDASALHRWHHLPRLKDAVIIALLVVILVVASALVALLTYWIAH